MPGGCLTYGANYVGVAAFHQTEPSGGTVNGDWSVNASGGVFALSQTGTTAPFYGSLQSINICPSAAVDGIAGTGDSGGYWLVSNDGGVYSFGDAVFQGAGAPGHSGTVAAIVGDPGTAGYWLVSDYGQVYAYGGSHYYGNSPALATAWGEGVVAMAATPSGNGYWMVTNYGRVFAFGDASLASYTSSPGVAGLSDWFTGIA